MLGAQLIGWKFPVTPVMLLLINVLGDGIPGICLEKEVSDSRIMVRKPIGRNESFFNRNLINVVFNFWLVSIIHVFTVRSRKSIFHYRMKENMPMVYSSIVMICIWFYRLDTMVW